MVASLTQRERRILQSELETYNMQLISLQIGTAPLSCYTRPEERNLLYSIAYKTTSPAKFSMNVTKDEDEGELTREELITLFTAKWDASAADTMMCLGYGMLPLTTRIITE